MVVERIAIASNATHKPTRIGHPLGRDAPPPTRSRHNFDATTMGMRLFRGSPTVARLPGRLGRERNENKLVQIFRYASGSSSRELGRLAKFCIKRGIAPVRFGTNCTSQQRRVVLASRNRQPWRVKHRSSRVHAIGGPARFAVINSYRE